MKLDLKRIAQEPGAVLPFDYELDLTWLEWNGNRPITQPVHVEGRVRNMAGALILNTSMDTTLSLECDRCTKWSMKLSWPASWRTTRTTTSCFSTVTVSWIWTSCWVMYSFSIWTQKISVPKTAKAFAPDAVPT